MEKTLSAETFVLNNARKKYQRNRPATEVNPMVSDDNHYLVSDSVEAADMVNLSYRDMSSPNFDPPTDKIDKVIAWIRLPGLPLEYYSTMALSRLGVIVGRVICFDRNTEEVIRGCYARVCVELYLTKFLVSKIRVGQLLVNIEYEGLNLICFSCGKVGHMKELCPSLIPVSTLEQPSEMVAQQYVTAVAVADDDKFGLWIAKGKGVAISFGPQGKSFIGVVASKQKTRQVRNKAHEHNGPASGFVFQASCSSSTPIEHGPLSRDPPNLNYVSSVDQITLNEATSLPPLVITDATVVEKIDAHSLHNSKSDGPLLLPPANPPSVETTNISLGETMDVDAIISTIKVEACPTIRQENDLLMMHKSLMAIFAEPRISGLKAEKVMRKLSFNNATRVDADGFSGGIWVLWKSEIGMVHVMEKSSQFITLFIDNNQGLRWAI
ncbi:hypothetical protein REPUB_Repub10bG0040500 [Reevesia pubescens]